MHDPFSHSMIKLLDDSKIFTANSSSPTSNCDTDHSTHSDSSPNNETMESVDLENGPAFGHQDDVSITWEDLGVAVSNRKHGFRSILQGLTGYAQPGEVLAIMGPSGCGKTTLLDALAGRLDSSTKHTGEVLINGRKQPLAYGTSAYVTQDDVITWTLTVREAVFYSAQLQLPSSMSLSKKKERAETTIKEMGLQDAMDTRIGGWGNKGLSGGQKRRVSICMEILTRPKLLFLDEPTSGLDSAASYYVMKRMIDLARQDRMTIIASIHQPSSQVFQLFHNLCLLSSGRTVYFGRSDRAYKFFESNGFPCPSHQNPSDHYLHTINTDFDEDMDQVFHANKTIEEAISFLVRSYKSSHTCQQIHRHVAEICIENREELKKGSQANFISQCLILTRRSFVNMYRDLGYYWLRLAIYIALCSGLGSVFYDIGSGKRFAAYVHSFFLDNYGDRGFPFICGGYEGFSTGKIKRTLSAGCICCQQHDFFGSLLACHIFDSRSNNLLSCRTPTRLRTLHLLRLDSPCLYDAGRNPNADCRKHHAKFPDGSDNRSRDPGVDDTKRRFLPVAP
ncbi:hypothetical protein DKX38_026747 [Salix brachista]|uniref:ABC transporter domain-containing protein n=1 Tax=Salix brachista TaxID=2182728 RepID=A0A5N5JA98_9ROSI|nr:hypothetical protein DKX38_026747 [Salix brachista]